MKNIFYLAILVLIAGCSTLTPEYTASTNQYHYQEASIPDANLISESLIYTYFTTQLEYAYRQNFCAGLSDCSDNINNIKNSPIFGKFDLNQHPVINNPHHISKINLYRITYSTQGQNKEMRKVSGAIFLPQTPKIKGVILFFHPTFFSKTSVPSFAPDKPTDEALAAVFAASGYIVLSPDYIGMGIDKDVFHPYVLYPQVNAQDGLFMLRASSKFLREHGYLTATTTPLFVSGYSEGGGYALWFSRLYQEQAGFKHILDALPYKLQLVAPISGVYDLSGVMYNYLFSDIGMFTKSTFNVQNSLVTAQLKPAIMAYVLTSYAYYNESSNFNLVFNPQFFNMQCSLQDDTACKFDNRQLNLYQAFSTQTDDYTLVMKISNVAEHKINNGGIFMDQFNSVNPLVNQQIINSDNLRKAMANGDIYYWHSAVPTTLIYLEHDSVVSSYNSIMALRGMTDAGSTNLNFVAMDNSLVKENMADGLPGFDIDHIRAFNYLYLIALAQFNNNQ